MMVCISLDRSTAYGGVMVNNQMNHTQFLLQSLKSDEKYVNGYLEICKMRGVLPSCTDFIWYLQLDWEERFNFERKPITDYLRKKFKESR